MCIRDRVEGVGQHAARGVGAQGAHLDARVRDAGVEPRGQGIHGDQRGNGGLGGRVHAGVDQWKVKAQQLSLIHIYGVCVRWSGRSDATLPHSGSARWALLLRERARVSLQKRLIGAAAGRLATA